MRSITLLFNPGDWQTTEKTIKEIARSSYDAFLLGLPEQLETTVREHIAGKIAEETVWREYRLLTGLHEKLIQPVRRRLQPLILHLRQRAVSRPETRICCYQDLTGHVESGRAAEKILLLQMAERIRKDVRVEEWRTALTEQLESSKVSWERSLLNLCENAACQDRNLLTYSGLIGPMKDHLLDNGFSVRVITLGKYWRTPIEVLRALMWLRGPNGVSDEEIEACVQHQMRYLDLVLSSESLDEAHQKWAATHTWT